MVKQVHTFLLAINSYLSLAVPPVVLMTNGTEWVRTITPLHIGAHALSNLFSVIYQGRRESLSLRASPHIPGSYRDRGPLCSKPHT